MTGAARTCWLCGRKRNKGRMEKVWPETLRFQCKNRMTCYAASRRQKRVAA